MRVLTGLLRSLAFAVAVGCGGGVQVRATMIEPARVPARQYEHVVIASRGTGAERRMSDVLARRLTVADRAPARAHVSELESMRLSGALGSGTGVLVVQVQLTEDARVDWVRRPETICGPLVCITTNRTTLVHVPRCEATVTVSLHDGPTGTLLARERLVERHEAWRDEEACPPALQRLAARLGDVVDDRNVVVEVELVADGLPGADRAHAELARGRWAEGRRILERSVRHAASLRPADRARLMHDLAMARRFDTALPGRFGLAARALRAAIALDPSEERYRDALRAVRAHARAERRLVERRDSAVRSAILDTLPPPPSAYGETRPAPGPGPETAP
ncbi:MAG: hypothetical protein NZ898_06375 [Myxococcota bacterium]|nr:hypothetical protein [Myxococcota bacterium]MDW8362649.1 hypothetical protein [Myxococcales bacterium]